MWSVRLRDPPGSCKLGATLLTPRSGEIKALAILLHGSGALDRDGSVPIRLKPYRDIATYLAENQVASLRFDKRSAIAKCAKNIGPKFLPQDYLTDIRNVVTAARSQKGLHELPLILVAHDQGVTFAIELLTKGGMAADGLVLLAGIGRYPLDATVMRQLRQRAESKYLAAAERNKAKALLAEGNDFFLTIREQSANENASYMGAYSRYWLNIIEMTDRTAMDAAAVKIPALVLQGTRDDSVTSGDYEALAAAFRSIEHSASALLPGLDHQFMKVNEKSVNKAALLKIHKWIDELVTH